MNIKLAIKALKALGIVLFLTVLAYVAVLFTGVGDAQVYRYTGHDITGKGKDAYHQQQHEKDQALRKKMYDMPKTTIEIDSAKWDFGDIKEGEKVEHTYKITNTGEVDLVIADVKVSCGCTLAEFTKEPVPPSETGVVSVIFDSTDKEGHTEKNLHVYTNTEHTPTTLGFMADISKP